MSATFPKKRKGAGEVTKGIKTWQAAQKAPPPPPSNEVRIRATRMSTDVVRSLANITSSSVGTAAVLAEGMNAHGLLGAVYSSSVAHQLYLMKGELAKERRAANASKAKLDAQWALVMTAARQAYAAAGLTGLTDADLDAAVDALTADKNAFNAVVGVLSDAVEDVKNEIVGAVPTGALVAATALIPVLTPVTIPIVTDLCSKPIQGKITKHLGASFNLRVRLTVWCPNFWHPFRTCKKTFTLAGVSFSLDLEVGYNITCCGATAWGLAHAQACGTVIGTTVCADCTAEIVGVAGIGNEPSGSGCNYGLGVTASLNCSLAGVTVFTASVPFGWTISGPCPPAVLPC